MNVRPTNYDALIQQTVMCLEQERFRDAEAFGRRALMRRPDSLTARQLVSSALIEQARYAEAAELLRQILESEPEDLPALADLGLCYFETCEFVEAERVLSRATDIDPNDPQTLYWMGLCVERKGLQAQADQFMRRAHEGDPSAYPMPTRITNAEFEAAIGEALDELPEPLRESIVNLTIVAADLPSDEDLMDFHPPLDPSLLGLYVGVPLPERSTADAPNLPDTIFIYKRNLERLCETRERLIEEIRITLLHEIGHYLGLDEKELEERGLA